MKIKKGDTVIVRTGKDKGKTGVVEKTLPQLNKVVVDGINIVKRAQKPTEKQPKGGISEYPAPIPVSNVGLVHPDDNSRSSRVGFKMKNGKKVRTYRQANDKEIS